MKLSPFSNENLISTHFIIVSTGSFLDIIHEEESFYIINDIEMEELEIVYKSYIVNEIIGELLLLYI